MKVKYLLLLLAFYCTTTQMQSQGLLDALKQTAEAHNEARGDTEEGNRELSDEEREQLDDFWRDNTKDAMDFINGLNKPNHQCLALIGLFSFQMISLQKAIDEERNCKMKYDYLGLQLLMYTGGLNLIPCAEKIYNMGNGDRLKLQTEFFASLFTCGEYDGYKWTPLAEKAVEASKKITGGYLFPPCTISSFRTDLYPDDRIDLILKLYFTPESIIENIVTVGQKMEALGCG